MQTAQIPRRVKALARLLALRFEIRYPLWRSEDISEDYWHAIDGYDVNLWCEDGELQVSAYSTFVNDEGFVETDYSNYVRLITRH